LSIKDLYVCNWTVGATTIHKYMTVHVITTRVLITPFFPTHRPGPRSLACVNGKIPLGQAVLMNTLKRPSEGHPTIGESRERQITPGEGGLEGRPDPLRGRVVGCSIIKGSLPHTELAVSPSPLLLIRSRWQPTAEPDVSCKHG
jgi:hypothetical protein